MKFYLTIIFFLMLSMSSFASTIYHINTGFGYITDSNGHIILKPQYNIGSDVPINDGLIYTEVPNQTTFNSIQLWVDPVVDEQAQQEVLIQQNMRALAIADLESKGVLTSDQANAQTSNLTTLNTAVSTSQNQTINAQLP